MKKRINRFVREYFSYSKKEKNGMLVLAGILFCLLLLRIFIWYIPHKQLQGAKISWISLSPPDSAIVPATPTNLVAGVSRPNLFPFDPNTADSAELNKLGFTEKQARGLIRFRNSGAMFRQAEDLLKLNHMTPQLYESIRPWVSIKQADRPSYKPSDKSRKEVSRERLNINTTDSIMLTSLSGIGAYSASKILRYRNWLGGFADTSQYREITGLRPEAVEALKSQAFIDTAVIRKLAINSVSESALWKHPYVRQKAKVIVKYREEHGDYKEAKDLLKPGIFNEEQLEKLLPYLDFR